MIILVGVHAQLHSADSMLNLNALQPYGFVLRMAPADG